MFFCQGKPAQSCLDMDCAFVFLGNHLKTKSRTATHMSWAMKTTNTLIFSLKGTQKKNQNGLSLSTRSFPNRQNHITSFSHKHVLYLSLFRCIIYFSQSSRSSSIPVGHWRDGLWDLFRHGYCHRTCWLSCCCTTLAAGQVISRLQVTWMGYPPEHNNHSGPGVTNAFRKLLFITLSYWVTRVFLLVIIEALDPNGYTPEWIEPPPAYHFFCEVDNVLIIGFMLFTAIILRNLRLHVRTRYAIPEADYCPSGLEDTCCSLLCPCFVAGQMLRHTADYDTYSPRCCSETGLPANAPSIV